MTAAELTTLLHRLIPLTKAMAAEVTVLSAEGLTLCAPLAANRNHAGSAFAGSLYSMASMAGWAFLYQLIQREQLNAELLLADGHIRYRRPLQQTLTAELRVSADEQLRFLSSLTGGHKARLRVNIGLPDLEQPAAQFQGLYVAMPAALPAAVPG